MELLESYERKLFLLEENAMRGNIHDLMPRLLKNKRELTRLRNYFAPLVTEASWAPAKPITLPPRRSMAVSKLRRVRVLGS